MGEAGEHVPGTGRVGLSMRWWSAMMSTPTATSALSPTSGTLRPEALIDWYAGAARDLPWRAGNTSPWAVMVSEVMLQQTPVARVLPIWQAWMTRWPDPADLAKATPADAVRSWAKLGYPRRALRLHAAARQIVTDFGGAVPSSVEELESLPGVGAYTARAIAAFAFGARTPVVDTNVARVLARAVSGSPQARQTVTATDRVMMEALLPPEPTRAALFSVAVMELGALVCTASAPACGACPIRADCAWQRGGAPADTVPRRAAQRFDGTDRQVRGLLLDVLRGSAGPVTAQDLDRVWDDAPQRSRALGSLLADGMVEHMTDGRFALPGEGAPPGRSA